MELDGSGTGTRARLGCGSGSGFVPVRVCTRAVSVARKLEDGTVAPAPGQPVHLHIPRELSETGHAIVQSRTVTVFCRYHDQIIDISVVTGADQSGTEVGSSTTVAMVFMVENNPHPRAAPSRSGSLQP